MKKLWQSSLSVAAVMGTLIALSSFALGAVALAATVHWSFLFALVLLPVLIAASMTLLDRIII